jgi:hypothetical protein
MLKCRICRSPRSDDAWLDSGPRPSSRRRVGDRGREDSLGNRDEMLDEVVADLADAGFEVGYAVLDRESLVGRSCVDRRASLARRSGRRPYWRRPPALSLQGPPLQLRNSRERDRQIPVSKNRSRRLGCSSGRPRNDVAAGRPAGSEIRCDGDPRAGPGAGRWLSRCA